MLAVGISMQDGAIKIDTGVTGDDAAPGNGAWMMLRWFLILIAAIGLTHGRGADAQLAPQDKGEQPTQLLSQMTGSNQAAIQDSLDQLTKAVTLLLREPVGVDTDAALVERMIGLENFQIDLTQTVLTYSVDPELRMLIQQNVAASTSAINELKSWQMNRVILQKQMKMPDLK